jgi:hypothetical protein
LPGNGHEMAQQIFGPQKSQPYVRGPRPLLQDGRIEIVIRRGPIVQQRNRYLQHFQSASWSHGFVDAHFASFEGHDFGVFGGANNGIVPRDGVQTFPPEIRFAVVRRV